jgi:hypothetical protein
VSFLREADQIGTETVAHLFAVKDAFSYRMNLGTGGPGGAQTWSARNPVYGVPFTAWVAPAGSPGGAAASTRDGGDSSDEGAGSTDGVAVVIRRAGDGAEVDRVPLRASGLQRVTWDLTEAPPEPEEGDEPGAGRPGGRREARGAPIAVGSFEAGLVRGTGADQEVLTEWRAFRVRVLPVGGM